MEMQPIQSDALTAGRSRSTPVRVEIKTVEMTRRRESSEEELELIEMRYHEALALLSLAELFAEGQLDCQ